MTEKQPGALVQGHETCLTLSYIALSCRSPECSDREAEVPGQGQQCLLTLGYIVLPTGPVSLVVTDREATGGTCAKTRNLFDPELHCLVLQEPRV